MLRRDFVSGAAMAAQRTRSRSEYGYVDWDWQRWHDITRESRPSIEGTQSGKGELAGLLEPSWPRRREGIERIAAVFFGRPPAEKPALDVRVLDESRQEGYTRRKLTY